MIPSASSSQHSPPSSKNQGKAPVHIPSTWSFWDLDSDSDIQSEEDEEVKEVLLPPEELAHCTRRGIDGDGDNLPGAKARKVMGISTDSWFEDSDDDDEERCVPYSSPSRSRSLRNPFKGGKNRPARLRSGHRRESITESESETDQAKRSSSKRRLSLSGVVAPFFAQSPRMRASPSPISSTISLFRSSLASPSTTTKRSLHATDDDLTDSEAEIQWTRKLDDAAKAAKWQSCIEHRPETTRPSSSCDSISSRLMSPALDVQQVVLPSRLDDLPSPSLSPALSKRLSQIQQCRSSSSMKQYQFTQHTSPPPRPPKSNRRGTKEKPALEEPLSPGLGNAHEVEYLKNKADDNDEAAETSRSQSGTTSPASSRSSQRVHSRGDIISPSLPKSTPRRQSNASSSASYDEQSPGLSQSSSTTHSSIAGTPKSGEKLGLAPLNSTFDPSLIHIPDHGVVSPFTKPRQAPPPPLLDNAREGLGLNLKGGDVTAESKMCSTRPRLTREDSSLDPIMSPPDRSDRPTSVPLSPPTISSDEYRASSDSLREGEDELLFALDRLDFNLELCDKHTSTSDYKNLGRISEEMADYFEIPFDAALPTSSPKTRLASDKHSSTIDSKPCIFSSDMPHTTTGWHKYTDAALCASPGDSTLDCDAILFLQHYDQ